eukprot:10293982-Lingulodinium_polyedra.AAC.1
MSPHAEPTARSSLWKLPTKRPHAKYTDMLLTVDAHAMLSTHMLLTVDVPARAMLAGLSTHQSLLHSPGCL